LPTVIPNGGGGDITSSEIIALVSGLNLVWDNDTQEASSGGGGGQTQAETQLVSEVEAKLEAIATGWVDSGGSGGRQQAVAHEILRRAALLQGDLSGSVRQWAKPGRDRALMEMFGVLAKAIVDRDRLLLELRERLNDSPY